MNDTTVICIVPVKNESWILEHFIEGASKWADVIIIGDNNSSDGSVGRLKQKESIKVIDLGSDYDEYNSRALLINEARKYPGRRLIFSIDADEMLSSNWSRSVEWNKLLNAQSGTMFLFDWVGILPGLTHYTVDHEMPAAFIDDGTEYQGIRIHSPRIPQVTSNVIKLDEIKLLHYTYIDPERMFSKHRLYKCIELVRNNSRPWRICITYQDTKIKGYGRPILQMNDEWLAGFDWLGPYRGNVTRSEKIYWYDEEVLGYFDTYGPRKFRKLNIWDVDWNKKAFQLGRTRLYDDPRSWYEKKVHEFIENHREDLKIRQNVYWKAVRLFGKTVLRALGW
jgi:hypothetical protein